MWNDFSATGGGFYNGPDATDTPTQNKDKGTRRLQNVVPVCIRQVRDCGGEEFTMFGVKSQILTLVCILRDYDVTSTKAVYKVEDHTGTISAILWLESDNNSVNLPPVKEGHYLRIYGSLRITDGVKTILVLKMMPILNINEISTHLLEVIHVRFATEKMSLDMNSGPNIAQNNPNAELANSMNVMYSGSNDNNFNPIQQKVYQLLTPDTSSNGMSREKILSNFQPGQAREVNKAIEYLSSEGHLYSTIDDNHFKSTNATG